MIDGTRILSEARRFEAIALKQGYQVCPGDVCADINDSVSIEVRDHPHGPRDTRVARQVEFSVADRKADQLKLTVCYNFGPAGTFLERVVNEKGSSMADIIQDTTVDAGSGATWLHMVNGERQLDAESRAIMQEWNIVS